MELGAGSVTTGLRAGVGTSRHLVATMTIGVLLAAAASCSSEPPTTAILISADERSELAYFPDLGAPIAPEVVSVVAGPADRNDGEGTDSVEQAKATNDPDATTGSELSRLYDTSATVEAMDRDGLRDALDDAPAAERATWASASGVDPDHLDDYVESLVPVWTARDMVLTEHIPNSGSDATQVVIYETGSPLLVRPDGSPAVGGNSGNPLSQGPDPKEIDDTVGEPWDGFGLDDVAGSPGPSRERRIVEPTTTSEPTTTVTTTTEARPHFGPIAQQDMEWAVELISQISERFDESCLVFDVMAADRSTSSLAFREHAGAAECGGDSLSTAYVIEFDQLVASGSACGDCEFDATGEEAQYRDIVDRFDPNWRIEVPRSLITGDNDCGIHGGFGADIRLVSRPPIDCRTAERIYNAYMASDDMQGSSAFADVEDFTCYMDNLTDPLPGDVTGTCEGSRGIIEMQIP